MKRATKVKLASVLGTVALLASLSAAPVAGFVMVIAQAAGQVIDAQPAED